MVLIDMYIQEGATKVLLTGHSLGGALATLCAADIAQRYLTVSVVCYPLNTPRVGDQKFVNILRTFSNLNILRVNTYGDIVPCVPYCGFTHTLRYVTLQTSYKNNKIAFYHVFKRHSVLTIQKAFSNL
jgi:predicted lipase